MKLAIIIFIHCSATYGQITSNSSTIVGRNGTITTTENIPTPLLERLRGSWKEDPSRRDNLDEFLEAANVQDTIRRVATSVPWVGEKTIAVDGNVVDIVGKTGPNLPGIFDPTFAHHLVVDNTTITKIDLKVVKAKVIINYNLKYRNIYQFEVLLK